MGCVWRRNRRFGMVLLLGFWRVVALRLTFPPARDWNDFLDNNSTDTPCGVLHTASSPVTTLAAGNKLNVTWSLTSPHIGGYKIQLLRPYRNASKVRNVWEPQTLEIVDPENVVGNVYGMRTLTVESLDTWGVMANPVSQWAMVNLPMEDCFGCTIRILRQAMDVESGDYVLWSCADVNIATSGVNQCHGCNGNLAPCQLSAQTSLWQCSCPPKLPYSGTYCERKDECVTDLDCGPANAKCIDILSSNSPSRQCYCLQGWSGPQCQTRSQLRLDPTVDVLAWERQYKFKLESENVSIFWSIVPGPPTGTSSDNREIEVAVAARTSSYVAIGWRPSGLPYSKLPHTDPSEEVAMSTAPPSQPPLDLSFLIAPSPSQDELLTPQPNALPESPSPVPSAPSMAETPFSPQSSIQEPAGETETYDSIQSPSPAADDSGAGVTVSRGLLDYSDTSTTMNELPETSSPEKTPISMIHEPAMSPDEDVPSPYFFPSASSSDSTSNSGTQTQNRTPVKPPQIVVEHEVEQVQQAGEMPLMFSLDLTIAYCRGNYYRVQDAWTYPSFSAPMIDTDLGGSNDISDAIGHEESNGMTYVIFRRPLLPSDPDLDYVITDNSDVSVVWALGQTSENFQQTFGNVTVTSEVESAIKHFYHPDELKYHGQGNAGGFGETNLILGQPTFNRKLCSNSTLPGYRCALKVNGDGFVFHWKLQQSQIELAIQTSNDGWFSVGFSPTGKAKNSDVVVAYSGNGVENKAFIKTYRIVNNTLSGLLNDSKLQLENPSIIYSNGTSILRFSVNYTDANFNISVGANRSTNIIWAISPNDSPNLSNHYLSGRGSFSINFATGEVHIESNPEKWYWIHGLIMSVAFAIVIPLSSVFARSGRVGSISHKGFASAFHIIFAVLGLIFAVIASFFAFTKFLGNPLHPLLKIHGFSGSILLVVLFFEVINGLICQPGKKDSLRKYWFWPHKLIGIGVVFGASAVSYFGFNRFHQITGRSTTIFLIVYGACFVFMLFIYAVLQCCKSLEKDIPFIASDYNLVGAAKAGKKWPPSNVTWPSNPRHSGNLKRPLRAHSDTQSEISTDSGMLPAHVTSESTMGSSSNTQFTKFGALKPTEISEI